MIALLSVGGVAPLGSLLRGNETTQQETKQDHEQRELGYAVDVVMDLRSALSRRVHETRTPP